MHSAVPIFYIGPRVRTKLGAPARPAARTRQPSTSVSGRSSAAATSSCQRPCLSS